MRNALISIIMPAYNAEKYISRAIESVLSQSYDNWELIIVNDKSKDDTVSIVEKYQEKDKRIKLYHNQVNLGAAQTRNVALKKSSGKYIAFLDSDDFWFSNKLDKQINFMEKNDYYFSCTHYGKITGENETIIDTITYPKFADYKTLLKYCPGNSTVIYNRDVIGDIRIPNIKKRNDYILWLKIIKKEHLHCLQETLSVHRVHDESISSNKLSLPYYHYVIYRKYEKLSVLQSLYLVCFWILKSIFK